jgi:hypothetical protein
MDIHDGDPKGISIAGETLPIIPQFAEAWVQPCSIAISWGVQSKSRL